MFLEVNWGIIKKHSKYFQVFSFIDVELLNLYIYNTVSLIEHLNIWTCSLWDILQGYFWIRARYEWRISLNETDNVTYFEQ